MSNLLAKTLPQEPTGYSKDLPDTVWNEYRLICPNNHLHSVIGSSRIVSCPDCRIYWNRDDI